MENKDECSRPKVSVIVPIYNVSLFLRQCLDSIVYQTLQEIEIILINDASPDPLDEIICLEYQHRYEQIIYIKHEINKGLGGARNTGIKLAKASYIAFVDSDDWIEPSMLEELYLAARKSCACISQSYFYEHDETKNDVKLKRVKQYQPKPDTMNAINVLAWNKLYKTQLFKENDIYYPEKLASEDIATMPRLLYFVQKVVLVKKGLYHYRINRKGSITSDYNKLFTDLPVVFQIIQDLLVRIEEIASERIFFERRVVKSLIHHLGRMKSDQSLTIEEKNRIVNNHLGQSFDFITMKGQDSIQNLDLALKYLIKNQRRIYWTLFFRYGRF